MTARDGSHTSRFPAMSLPLGQPLPTVHCPTGRQELGQRQHAAVRARPHVPQIDAGEAGGGPAGPSSQAGRPAGVNLSSRADQMVSGNGGQTISSNGPYRFDGTWGTHSQLAHHF
ncbi:hypothetical protein JCM9534A_11440 [Catenuloplanes indicus JCM 9534]